MKEISAKKFLTERGYAKHADLIFYRQGAKIPFERFTDLLEEYAALKDNRYKPKFIENLPDLNSKIFFNLLVEFRISETTEQTDEALNQIKKYLTG